MRRQLEPKWRLALRQRALRVLYAAIAFLGVAALVGCAWAKATFSDEPGAIRCDPARCDGDCRGGVCMPYDRPTMGAVDHRDAG